jgi:hypothetical protein
MKNVLKLVAVIGVAFALAGCGERSWKNEPMVEANFDPELSEYMNKNLPKIDVVQGEKVYMDIHPMDSEENKYVIRVFVDGEIRYGTKVNALAMAPKAGVAHSDMEGLVIEYSDAEGYKIQHGKSTVYAYEQDIAAYISDMLINHRGLYFREAKSVTLN